MKINYNIIFILILAFLVILIVHPLVFEQVNRIEPWVFGVPFVMFWVIFIALCMCFTMIGWYFTDKVTGNIDVDIELATEEEMKSWQTREDV